MRKSNFTVHEPVLLDEVLRFLRVKAHSKYIDATVGHGGHTIEIFKKGGDVLGIDEDKKALEVIRQKFETACPATNSVCGLLKLANVNFIKLLEVSKDQGFENVEGILFDLGVNTDQLKSDKRGFSFRYPDTPLDMRLDPENQGPKASDLLNALRKDQLKDLFSKVLTPFEAKRITEKVLDRRKEKPFVLVKDLLEITGTERTKAKIHPATKAFLALRIAVNSELENLKEVLPKAFNLLKKEGRLLIITFHSGEDRIVKEFFKKKEMGKEAKILTKKPVEPSENEKQKNPKSRSAKLRIIEKI